MNKIEALSRAKQIAGLIIQGAGRIGRTSIREQGLMGGLSVHLAAQKMDIAALNPRVKEVILFGSAAEAQLEDGEARIFDVGDIDIMMFDGGFYSNVLSLEPAESRTSKMKKKKYSWSPGLRENIALLFHDYFDFYENSMAQEILNHTQVDLHIMPISFFCDKAERRRIASLHYDPNFFGNAFSNAMRYDEGLGEFVPVTLAELEEKYRHQVAEPT